jgi:acetyltransferase-like isoleucine patch superfamily enzyme
LLVKFDQLYKLAKPLAKRVVHRSLEPSPSNRWLFSGIYQANWFAREFYEWARRSLVATPVFLSQCTSHGTDITADRLPYISGPCSIELGSHIRFGGTLVVLPSGHGELPVLKIGSGVYFGHEVAIGLGRRVEIGDYVAIGGPTFITDTEGHNQYNPDRPIWEVPPSDEDVAEVVIEDRVQIAQSCVILKGVRIGARSIIGAGSVVRSNIPPDSVVMGNPARVVKRMRPDEQS